MRINIHADGSTTKLQSSRYQDAAVATAQIVNHVVFPDGRQFQDIRDLKRLLLQDDRVIARNLVRQLTVFATGAPVRFSDRDEVEKILAAAKAGGYGVRSIVHGIVQSELFRNQ